MVRRVRRTHEVIQGQREAASLAGSLGGNVRVARRAKRLSLADLGARVGLSRTRLAEIERGEGAGTPLQTWIRSIDAPDDGASDRGRATTRERATMPA